MMPCVGIHSVLCAWFTSVLIRCCRVRRPRTHDSVATPRCLHRPQYATDHSWCLHDAYSNILRLPGGTHRGFMSLSAAGGDSHACRGASGTPPTGSQMLADTPAFNKVQRPSHVHSSHAYGCARFSVRRRCVEGGSCPRVARARSGCAARDVRTRRGPHTSKSQKSSLRCC